VKIITNNPDIYDELSEKMDILFVDGQYIDVLITVRDMVHCGYKVLTHPLMGSIKPNQTPYRSLIIEHSTSLDFQSLDIIENSIETCKKFLKDKPSPVWNEKILEDFRFVDKRLFQSALESL